MARQPSSVQRQRVAPGALPGFVQLLRHFVVDSQRKKKVAVRDRPVVGDEARAVGNGKRLRWKLERIFDPKPGTRADGAILMGLWRVLRAM